MSTDSAGQETNEGVATTEGVKLEPATMSETSPTLVGHQMIVFVLLINIPFFQTSSFSAFM